MNCDSCEVPKNSLIDATTGRMLISVCGVIASTSCVVMRSRTTRSMRDRPTRIWFWISSPDGPQPAVAEVVDVVGLVALFAGVQPDEVLDGPDDVVLGQCAVRDRLG